MKTQLFILVTFGIYSQATALKCYICDSTIHGPSCFDPLDDSNIKAMECKDVYRYQRQGSSPVSANNTESEVFNVKWPEKLQNWNPSYPNQNSNSQPVDFECVQYEQFFTRSGRRQLVRRCQRRNQSPNFCGELQNIGQYQGFQLTKCDVCYSDYCNRTGSVKLSLLLNFAFFLLFYRCTDF